MKDVEATVTVIGWENVTVPAGEFRALKLSKIANQRWEPFPGQTQSSKLVGNYWYVPALKNYVRQEVLEVSSNGSVSLGVKLELDSFRVQ